MATNWKIEKSLYLKNFVTNLRKFCMLMDIGLSYPMHHEEV